ncbi:MAG TPA: hypothetical protein VM145_00400, partial [Sphingomicrobium sp.]|nr:hypothetical protein [Sphingomicrobium sp.]
GIAAGPNALAHKQMGAGIAASPHVRRAKDLPVFVTWSKPVKASTRSRSWLTSSGVASYRTAPS